MRYINSEYITLWAVHGGITPCMRSCFHRLNSRHFVNETTRYMRVWLCSLREAINLLKRYAWFQSFLTNQFVDLIEWRWALRINQLTFCEVNKALFFTKNFHECAHSKLYTVKYARKSFSWVFEIVFLKKSDLTSAQVVSDRPTHHTGDAFVTAKMYFLCVFVNDVCLTQGLSTSKDWLLYSSLQSSLALGLTLEMEIKLVALNNMASNLALAQHRRMQNSQWLPRNDGWCFFSFVMSVYDYFLIYPGENNMRSTMSTGRSQDKSNASSLLDDSQGLSLGLPSVENEMHQMMECHECWHNLQSENKTTCKVSLCFRNKMQTCW